MPARPLSRSNHEHNVQSAASSSSAVNDQLFLDPMMGTPLSIYIDNDVSHRGQYAEAVAKHGGTVSSSYSACTYLCVDPHTDAGQSLFHQYSGKTGKLVLDAQWIFECVTRNKVLGFQDKWAGYKVTGNEQVRARGASASDVGQRAEQRNIYRQTQNVQDPQAVVQVHSQGIPQHAHVPKVANRKQPPNRPLPPEDLSVEQQPQRAGSTSLRGRQARLLRQPVTQHPPPQPQPSASSPHLVSAQIQVQPQPVHPTQTPQDHYNQIQSTQAQPPMLTVQSNPTLPTAFGYHVYSTQPAGRATVHPQVPQHHQQQQQSWQAASPLTPHATPQHLQTLPSRTHPAQQLFTRDSQWSDQTTQYEAIQQPPSNVPIASVGEIQNVYYDTRYRDDNWNGSSTRNDYYDSQPKQDQYEASSSIYVSQQSESYDAVAAQHTPSMQQAPQPQIVERPTEFTNAQNEMDNSSPAPESMVRAGSESPDELRGRKRTRPLPPQPHTLVLSRRRPPLRSPTPPTRVLKSTYGGNLFTADDVEYLRRYIEYCQSQGLVLSLREICERIAVKAPHHTFYSWRRYCNKHQIRLGGYTMDNSSQTPSPAENGTQQTADNDEDQLQNPETGVFNAMVLKGDGPFTLEKAERQILERGLGTRSPSPPKSLFRSTTGKGVAFTAEDVSFLCKFLAYRKLQGRLDMVSFWKDVSTRAPHHSRASWMKYYRRHKHELHRSDADEPLPLPPGKKMRYSRDDDNLLARHFAAKPEGTSDHIFQAFAKVYPHHPWKGWQEHYRIHKSKIDKLIKEFEGTSGNPTVPANDQITNGGEPRSFSTV